MLRVCMLKQKMRICLSLFLTLPFLLNSYECAASLEELERLVRRDLEYIYYPTTTWRLPDDECLDVAIIGSGVGGLTTAFALSSIGIWNYKLFDQNREGCEGPWATYAKMKTLRSDKELVGPAINVPHLTFRAWYESQNGLEGWNDLIKIPTMTWMHYLCWFRHVLNVPVENDVKLTIIQPQGNRLLLTFDTNGQTKQVLTRKVILATGRNGFGGGEVPSFIMNIPSQFYAHTSDPIDYTRLKGKTVAVIGVGASGWDSVGESLEQGATQVDMLMRRDQLPNDFVFADNHYPGYQIALASLPDEIKLQFIKFYLDNGVPPPGNSVQRVEQFRNFNLISNISIQSVSIDDQQIVLHTNQGERRYDFLILATGITIDAKKQPELNAIADKILTWEDRPVYNSGVFPEKLKSFPYLGAHFELLEKNSGEAPYLKNIYCFNYAALLSQGALSIDILGFPIGAKRIAEGVAMDLFLQDWQAYFNIMNDGG